jgi:hypothetical protein
LDPSGLLVDVYNDKSLIKNTLIDLGETINVMTKDTILKLSLHGLLRYTPTVIQLVDISTLNPEGTLEDVMVSINFWEDPTDFMVLQTNSKLKGYPLTIGIPCLTTIYAYINCRVGNMTITNGQSQKLNNVSSTPLPSH